jgi:hypothetical protein
MKNGMDYVADWLIWPNGMLLETLDILHKYEGKRMMVFKKNNQFEYYFGA